MIQHSLVVIFTFILAASAYRLTYFNGRGVTEVIRLVFNVAKVPFVDERLSIDDFRARKATGEFRDNMDRLPLLVFDDGFTLGQSRSIERYLAKKYGLYGSNELEAAKVDVICEHCRDIKDKYMIARIGKTGQELDEAKKTFVASLPTWFQKLEVTLPTGPHCVGDKISLADVYLFHLTCDFFDRNEEYDKNLLNFPKILEKAHCVRDQLVEYLSNRPVTPW